MPRNYNCIISLFLMFGLFFHIAKAYPRENNTNINQPNGGIAVVDTEYLFKKFADDNNIRNKIMNDYKLCLNKTKYSKELLPDAKQQVATEELDKIIMHYSYQISNIITEVLNNLIKEYSLSLVVNKKSFSMKKALFSPEIQRNSNGRNITQLNSYENRDGLPKEKFEQFDNYFNQPILSTAYSYTDLTSEAFKRINKKASRIKILPYGRTLKE